MKLPVRFPKGVRCALALSYDTDMAGGYSPDGVCHGRTAAFLVEYILRLCDTAEEFGVRLHFFQIGNGLEEDQDMTYLREILRRGHLLDSHTYSHLPLNTPDVARLDDELARTNRLFGERLGWKSIVLRGPGGYQEGLKGLPRNQEVILKNGFRWVSCQYNATLGRRATKEPRTAPLSPTQSIPPCEGVWTSSLREAMTAPSRDTPYAYPTGLIEIPIQGFTDRHWFDTLRCVSQEAYALWRKSYGHQPVPAGWRCPWTARAALEDWIGYNLETLEYAYENRLLWVPVWHPYSHYLHDPENEMLPALLSHAASKSEKVWVCTLRDAAAMLVAPEMVTRSSSSAGGKPVGADVLATVTLPLRRVTGVPSGPAPDLSTLCIPTPQKGPPEPPSSKELWQIPQENLDFDRNKS